MTNEFDKDKVLLRVKKMMALANDAAASEGERDNALRMAHATLAKYNLTMGEATAVGQEETRLSNNIEGKNFPWMRTTANAVAKLFFCHYFFSTLSGGKVRHYFVGKEANVFTAMSMAQYVIDSISKEGVREAKANGDTASGTYWRSFCKGAAHQVYRRCIEIQTTAEKAPAVPGTALVLASVYASEAAANAAFIRDQMGTKLRTGKNRERNSSWGAYESGRQYGNKVGLNRQVGGGGSKPTLLK